MRTLIIEKLHDLKLKTGGFPKCTRWNVKWNDHYARDVNFESLDDGNLLSFYDLILFRYNIQM